jgi:hypothetical protein
MATKRKAAAMTARRKAVGFASAARPLARLLEVIERVAPGVTLDLSI